MITSQPVAEKNLISPAMELVEDKSKFKDLSIPDYTICPNSTMG